MPSLSTTVMKVLEICNNPRTSANDLNRVIALDPVLTARVLKLINSAYYSLRSQVTSLTRAIIMLGINTVKNLALSTAVLETMGGASAFKAFDADEFWTHSLGVGVTAKYLAIIRGVGVMDREEYFVAGLLHDLGKIPLSNTFPDEYRAALAMAREQQVPLHRAEEAALGASHTQVGRFIAEKWRFNDALWSALAAHHGDGEVPPGGVRLAATVALANLYVNISGLGLAGDAFPERATLEGLMRAVGVKRAELTGLKSTIQAEIEKARVFLRVAGA